MTSLGKVLERSAWLAWAILMTSICGLAYMIWDSAPPFKMLAYGSNSPRPGELLRVNVIVQRDLGRDCSVVFSRHMFDSTGTRIDLQPATSMTAEALAGLERASPGRLILAVPIPTYATPGPAQLVTPLQYVCNAWHSVRPIETTMVIRFEVRP